MVDRVLAFNLLSTVISAKVTVNFLSFIILTLFFYILVAE